MSERVTINLTRIGLAVSLAASLFGLSQAYAVLPYRLEQAEKAVKILQDKSTQDHEILIRIEERLKTVQMQIERK